MDDGGNAKSVHLAARSYQTKLMQELAQKDPALKDQRRKGLARGLMTKYTRELLHKHSCSAQNFYFQHSNLSALLARKQCLPGGDFDGSKGLDLNSVYHLSLGIEDETQSIGAFGSFINILRHLLLIPTDSSLAGRIWSLIEMFVHQLVMSKDDGKKDIAKIGVDEFKQAFEAKDKPNIKDRHKVLDCIGDAMSILFPKLAAGNFDSDPNFQSTPRPAPELSRKNTRKIKVTDPSKHASPVKDALSKESPTKKKPSSTPTGKPPSAPRPDAETSEPPPAPPQKSEVPEPPPISAEGGPPPPPPPPPPPLAKGPAVKIKPTMKRFNWVKLTPQQIHGTVFQQDDHDGTRLPVNVSELERKFALKPAVVAVASGNAQTKARGAAVLHLLDAKKAQNLGILLTSIRASYSEIRRAIVSQDSGVLSVGNAISLIKLLPHEDEKALLGANRDGILGKPEKFLVEIMDIPLLRERLEGYVLKKEFEFRVEDATKILDDCSTCLADVQGSSGLQTLLHFVLDIGNAMNKGYVDRNGGGAQGFKLSSILKLQDTKTCDNKSNLLFHIVEHIEECAPFVLEMAYKEMPLLKKGTKEYLQSAQMEVKELTTQVSALEHALGNFASTDPDDDFVASSTTFANQATDRLKELSAQLDAVKQQYNSVAKFYGEDGDQEDFVSILVTFCSLLEKTQDDLAFVRSEAEKSAKKDRHKLKCSEKKDDLLSSQEFSSPISEKVETEPIEEPTRELVPEKEADLDLGEMTNQDKNEEGPDRAKEDKEVQENKNEGKEDQIEGKEDKNEGEEDKHKGEEDKNIGIEGENEDRGAENEEEINEDTNAEKEIQGEKEKANEEIKEGKEVTTKGEEIPENSSSETQGEEKVEEGKDKGVANKETESADKAKKPKKDKKSEEKRDKKEKKEQKEKDMVLKKKAKKEREEDKENSDPQLHGEGKKKRKEKEKMDKGKGKEKEEKEKGKDKGKGKEKEEKGKGKEKQERGKEKEEKGKEKDEKGKEKAEKRKEKEEKGKEKQEGGKEKEEKGKEKEDKGKEKIENKNLPQIIRKFSARNFSSQNLFFTPSPIPSSSSSSSSLPCSSSSLFPTPSSSLSSAPSSSSPSFSSSASSSSYVSSAASTSSSSAPVTPPHPSTLSPPPPSHAPPQHTASVRRLPTPSRLPSLPSLAHTFSRTFSRSSSRASPSFSRTSSHAPPSFSRTPRNSSPSSLSGPPHPSHPSRPSPFSHTSPSPASFSRSAPALLPKKEKEIEKEKEKKKEKKDKEKGNSVSMFKLRLSKK